MKKQFVLSTAAVAAFTLAFAPVASAATGSNASPVATNTTASKTTVTSAQLQAEVGLAVAWMNANGVQKLPFWTQVADYAGTGAFTSKQWTAKDLANLKASTDYAKAILGVLASGQDPHDVAGVNLVAKLAGVQLKSGTAAGKFADNLDGTGTDLINNQSWAIIALEDAGGVTYNRISAANWLISQQNKDGGWGYSSQYNSSDPDDTAAGIVALKLLGYSTDSTPIAAAVKYLQTQEADDGGLMNGSTTGNSDSTGVTIDALASVGISATSWQAKTGNPVTALAADFDAKSGGFKFDNSGSSWSGVSAMSTRDSIFGLAAVETGESVYQRLHVRTLNQLNQYWTNVYKAGGTSVNHKHMSWDELRSMALAGTYLSNLTPKWQAVVAHHGMNEAVNGKSVWEAWGPALADEALQQSFGLDTVHLNLLTIGSNK